MLPTSNVILNLLKVPSFIAFRAAKYDARSCCAVTKCGKCPLPCLYPAVFPWLLEYHIVYSLAFFCGFSFWSVPLGINVAEGSMDGSVG